MIGSPLGLTQQARNFTAAIAQLAASAKQPGFAVDAWQALASGVATDSFLYVGRVKEVLRWPDFLAQLDRRMRTSDLLVTIERVEESGNLVFLQLDERSTRDETIEHLTTMTIFEYDAQGRLHRIDSFQ